jgi:hypothetical protein
VFVYLQSVVGRLYFSTRECNRMIAYMCRTESNVSVMCSKRVGGEKNLC